MSMYLKTFRATKLVTIVLRIVFEVRLLFFPFFVILNFILNASI